MQSPPKLTVARSSSADDYRSVIDDLTVEIQKLKDELRRYKQKGPDMLRKEKLFEIKVHGLPKRKKRELEATLRDFAASLEGSPDASSSQRNKTSRHPNRDRMYSNSGSMSKHASSSSGSNARPADSAYASMSTGNASSGPSLGRQSMSSRARTSEQKVESYLRDIPEGLYPRHVIMTEKEKKKLVVRRLEHLFTGKMGGRQGRRKQEEQQKQQSGPHSQSAVPGAAPLAPVMAEVQAGQRPMMHQPPSLMAPAEASREAKILPPDQQSGSRKKSRSRDNGSASNSGGDQTESGGNGNSSGGTNTSPTAPPPPEQRPTRPKDLDPDRAQVPSENMKYIRHLGLVPPELLQGGSNTGDQVKPDAEGWVYLNLLCNLAQLHMINVTPDFVRAAVSGVSTKFQLSPDGRKIRWRGGSDGTKFSSDSSGENSQHSIDADDTDNSNKGERRKRQKTGNSTGDGFQSGGSSKDQSKFGAHLSGSSESFHYKPLFVHQGSSGGQTSLDDTLSSFGPVEESNADDSRWGQSGSGNTSGRRKRRHDGAIIYYSGAPFCTDLSGDPGDLSPAAYMLSTGQEMQESPAKFRPPPLPRRSESGSILSYRPLSDTRPFESIVSKMDVDASDNPPDLSTDSGDDVSEVDFDLQWSDAQQFIEVHPLDPCGLGGVLPDDHFMVVVTTKRLTADVPPSVSFITKLKADETTESIINRLALMSTSSPAPPPTSRGSSRCSSPAVEIEYVSGRIKRLAPAPLPPPAIFFPPFSTDTSGSEGYDDLDSDDDDDSEISDEVTSRRANIYQSDDYPDGVDLSSGDEDGEDPDNEPDTHRMYEPSGSRRPNRISRRQSSAEAAAGTSARGRTKSASIEAMVRIGGSSAATAGGIGSEVSSSDRMSS
jgi:hypothetical protein